MLDSLDSRFVGCPDACGLLVRALRFASRYCVVCFLLFFEQ